MTDGLRAPTSEPPPPMRHPQAHWEEARCKSQGTCTPPDTACGVSGCTATLESNLAVSYKAKLTPTLSPSKSKDCVHVCTSTGVQMFTAMLSLTAPHGNSPNVHHQ